jgi:methionyl-tRNA formyltransferase
MLIFCKGKALHKLKMRCFSVGRRFFSSRPRLNEVSQPAVTFFGSDQFSLRILVGLNKLAEQNRIGKLSVVTSINKNNNSVDLKSNQIKINRVIEYCEANKIDFHIWSQLKEKKSYIRELNSFHMGVVASFGHLLPGDLISIMP